MLMNIEKTHPIFPYSFEEIKFPQLHMTWPVAILATLNTITSSVLMPLLFKMKKINSKKKEWENDPFALESIQFIVLENI